MEVTTGSLNSPESYADIRADMIFHTHSLLLSLSGSLPHFFPQHFVHTCRINVVFNISWSSFSLFPHSLPACLCVFYLFCLSSSPSRRAHADFTLCQPNTQGTESCPSTCVPVLFEHGSVLSATLCHYTSIDTLLTEQPHSWLYTYLNILVWSAEGSRPVFLRVERVSAPRGKVVEKSLYKSSERKRSEVMLVVNYGVKSSMLSLYEHKSILVVQLAWVRVVSVLSDTISLSSESIVLFLNFYYPFSSSGL